MVALQKKLSLIIWKKIFTKNEGFKPEIRKIINKLREIAIIQKIFFSNSILLDIIKCNYKSKSIPFIYGNSK